MALLAAAALPRVLPALNKSLWLDEFHSLHHAEAPDLAAFFDGLRGDNHPPLFFLALRASVALFGRSELALRVPALLFGLWTVLLCARMARKLPGTWASLGAPLLLCASSLHVLVSTEARMYSLLALAVSGLLLALLDGLEGGRVHLRVLLWCAVGLHTHYYFLHYLAVLGSTASVVAWCRPEARAGLRSAGVGLLLALVASLPWYATGFPAQLANQVPPGNSGISPPVVLEAFVHLLFIDLRVAGPAARVVFLASGGLALALAAWALVRLARGELRERGAEVLLVASVAVGAPLWAGLLAAIDGRFGFGWRYVASSSGPFAILICMHAGRTPAALVRILLVLLPASALSMLGAFSGGTERYREAVQFVLEEHEPREGLIVIESGPKVFPPALGWEYYSARLQPEPGARFERLAMENPYVLADPADLGRYERVRLFVRGAEYARPTLEHLRERFAVEESREFGYSLAVYTFSEPRVLDGSPRSGGETAGPVR